MIWRKRVERERLDEIARMCDAPYDTFRASDWCHAANDLLSALRDARAGGCAADALREILSELGVPGDEYAAPVGNAVHIARDALARFDRAVSGQRVPEGFVNPEPLPPDQLERLQQRVIDAEHASVPCQPPGEADET